MEDLNILIQRAKQGDKDAFGRIYELFFKRIYRYCYYSTGNAEHSKDICQDTFIKAWRALPSFKTDEGSSIQAFLYRIARNLIIDSSRKKTEYNLENAQDVETNEDFISEIDKKDEIKKVHLALKELDNLERQIIILRFFEELSFQEVSKITGVNEGALRVKVHRSLKKLKDILKK